MQASPHPSSPAIAYCIIHQAAPKASDEDDIRTVTEFHGLLGECAASRSIAERAGGLQYSLEGRVSLPASKESAERRMLEQGMECLWQRKLGLGSGVEYPLRLVGRDALEFGKALHRLSAAALHSAVKQALAAQGRLVLKEILYPL